MYSPGCEAYTDE